MLEDRRPGREGQEGDALGLPAASLLVADGQRLRLGVWEQAGVDVQRAEVADANAQQLGQVQAAADRRQHQQTLGRVGQPRLGEAPGLGRRRQGPPGDRHPFSRNHTLAPMAKPATAASGWPSRARANSTRERFATDGSARAAASSSSRSS